MVEPLIAQLAKINERGRIYLVIAQTGRGSGPNQVLIIGPDEQSMVGVRVIPMMLRIEVKIPRLAGSVVAGHGEYRNVEVGKLLPIGQIVLPIRVKARVIQPPNEDRIVLSIKPAQVAVASAAAIPLLIEFPPRRR